MSVLDIIIIAVLISFTAVSAVWGMTREIIAVGGLIVGIVVAGILDEAVANDLAFITDPTVARGVAFVLIVLVFSLLSSVIASILYFLIGLLFLGPLDHFLGAALGLIQGMLAVAVILVGAVVIFPTWTQDQLHQSVISNNLVGPLSSAAVIFAPAPLKNAVEVATLPYR